MVYNMALLYELEGIYAQLQDMELDDETFQDTLDSINFQEDLENNIDYFVKMYKNSLADAEACKREKDTFAEKEKRNKAKADKFKEYIKRALEISNVKKVDTGKFKVSLRKSKKIEILDETKIPLDYMKEKHEWTPNKVELAKVLKAGVEIEGAALVENESLQVN